MSRTKMLAIVLIAFVLPFRYLASPDWRIRVLNEDGHPQGNVRVRLSYENYSTENKEHEEEQVTDKNGYVHFAAHKRWTTLLLCLLYSVFQAQEGVHASFGRHASAFAFSDGGVGDIVSGGYVYDWTGQSA